MALAHVRNVRGFFSDYYLGNVFGRGTGRGRRRKLSDKETDAAYVRFRRIHEHAEGRCADAASTREGFARPFLRDVLRFHLAEGEERVHPLFRSAEAAEGGARPLAIAYCGGWDEDLDARRGQARQSVERALTAAGLGYGLLLTAERCRLVRAAGEGPSGSYLEADLEGLAEEDDPESFAAVYRLLRIESFEPAPDGTVPLHEVERESRAHAEKVSEDLKGAVFTAAESLVGGLISDAVNRGEVTEPAVLPETQLRLYRDAALTALYRILFILYAEARDPRLDEHRVYRDSYSAHGLAEDLFRDPARDWPDNRSSFWPRLLALFRIYDKGLPAITPWENIPPRGGMFFSSESPEGRLLRAACLSDRAVARLLLDLTTTTPHRGVGRERVSFRELDIESLGAVYEGLLEYEPRIAAQDMLDLRVQGRQFVLTPRDTVRLCGIKKLQLRGDVALVAGTEAEELHPEAGEEDEDEDHEAVEESAEGEAGEGEEEGIKAGAAARLVRRVSGGTFHFAPGAARKGTSSFYTPRPLVADLVSHALGPLVEGRAPAEIEALRVLDPACGSAHFLVEAMRFLGRSLHRAYVIENGGKAPPHFRSTTGRDWDADWEATDADARASLSETRAWCKRRIAERCLFGVDLNPTAVTLAHVSLWVESVAGDRPLTYFEHHVRCGNSVLGSFVERLARAPFDEKDAEQRQAGIWAKQVRDAVRDAAALRRLIDQAPSEDLASEGIDPESVAEQEYKDSLRRRAEAALRGARLSFDLRSAALLVPDIWRDWFALANHVADPAALETRAKQCGWWEAFTAVRDRERFFHWELEFPEVLLDTERPGFDAVLGNPPWDKVLPAKHDFYARVDPMIRAFKGAELDRRIGELHAERAGLGEEFEAYSERTKLVARFLRSGGDFPLSKARSQAAHEDVSKYFLDRALLLTARGGAAAFLVPSVVYNGDGCVGLRRHLLDETAIERFYGFENRLKLFPIDSRYKYVCLVARKGAASDSFDAAFMRHDPAELAESGPKPWIVRVTPEEIQRHSPETLAFLEYRSPRDQEIVRKMAEGKPRLGDVEGPGAWGARFVSWRAHLLVYNITEDKDLWTDPASGRLYSPADVLGAESSDVGNASERMRERGFVPVFEGKHIEQCVVGTKPIRWWLSVPQAEAKYAKRPIDQAILVFRETASNTNERTCIAAVMPPRSAAANSLYGLLFNEVDPEAAGTVLNSLSFDFALRLRTAGTHVHPTYMRPMPVPPADVVNRLPRIPTHLAWEHGLSHITDKHDLWPLLWDANRAVAEAYGLTAEDFAHILQSFPVFARKRPEFFAYLQARLAEWKAGAALEYRVAEMQPPLAAEKGKRGEATT
jgi:hypothetical protein